MVYLSRVALFFFQIVRWVKTCPKVLRAALSKCYNKKEKAIMGSNVYLMETSEVMYFLEAIQTNAKPANYMVRNY